MIRALVCVVVALHLAGGVAFAQNAFSSDVGVRTWVTSGYTKWNFAVEVLPGLEIDPLSELRWRGTDMIMTEAHADFVWRRLVLILTLGGGHSDAGVMIDDDFLLSGRQARFSYTRSNVEGSSLYATGDVGYRVWEWHEPFSGTRGFIDTFVGYQYWAEDYEAFGALGFQHFPPFAGVPIVSVGIADSVKGITHTYRLHSLRVGARAAVPIGMGFAGRFGTTIFPYTRTEQTDVHHLRTGLAQDPSGRSRANGGFGFEVDGALTYEVWNGLSVEAGYRFRRIDSGGGTDTTFFSDGTTGTARLNEIVIERGGPYFGVRYRF
jgi:hypothetical protein